MIIGIAVLEDCMIKKVINYFDHHRLFLVLLILILIIILFLGINSYLFLHHEFIPLTCTEELDENYCYHEDKMILIDPKNSQNRFFKRYDDEIKMLQDNYNLDDFNYYTAYYYLVAARLQYTTNQEYKILKDFFEVYANTYNLEDFYFHNSIYFNLFYHYKIN